MRRDISAVSRHSSRAWRLNVKLKCSYLYFLAVQITEVRAMAVRTAFCRNKSGIGAHVKVLNVSDV
jgi:hypothetical protein